MEFGTAEGEEEMERPEGEENHEKRFPRHIGTKWRIRRS
jgi:hypothetical protein